MMNAAQKILVVGNNPALIVDTLTTRLNIPSANIHEITDCSLVKQMTTREKYAAIITDGMPAQRTSEIALEIKGDKNINPKPSIIAVSDTQNIKGADYTLEKTNLRLGLFLAVVNDFLNKQQATTPAIPSMG